MVARRLGTILALVGCLASPASVAAQETEVDRELLTRLCAANATTEAELATCLDVVSSILAPEVPALPDPDLAPDAPPGADLVVELGAIVEDAVAAAQGTDVQAAIDEVIAAAEGVDIEALIAAAIEEAGAAAEGFDLQALVDEALAQALAATGQLDAASAIDEGVESTRNVIAAAEAWVVENADMVCGGGSLGGAVAAAAVVGYLTGSPGLAIQAFEETEQVAREACAGMTVVE